MDRRGSSGSAMARCSKYDEFFSAVSQEICPLCGQFAAGQMVELPWFRSEGLRAGL